MLWKGLIANYEAPRNKGLASPIKASAPESVDMLAFYSAIGLSSQEDKIGCFVNMLSEVKDDSLQDRFLAAN